MATRMALKAVRQYSLLSAALLLGASQASFAATDVADLLGEGEALGTLVDGHAPLRVSLLADAAVVTPGEQIKLGLHIHLDPGWHIYWQQPGAAGLSTEIAWRSGHAVVGNMAWPAPEVFRESDGVVTYGYASETLLWAAADISDSVSQSLPIEAHIDYLACNIICSPGQVTVRRTIAVGQATVPADRAIQSIFERYQSRLPVTSSQVGIAIEATTQPNSIVDSKEFSVNVNFRWQTQPKEEVLHFRREAFIPDAMEGLSLHVVSARAAHDSKDSALLSFRGHIERPQNPQKIPSSYTLSGIVQLEGERGPLQPITLHVNLPVQLATALSMPVQHDNAVSTPMPQVMPRAMMPAATTDDVSLGYALLLALIGGLILNLMPCVLPVLALKVVGMAQIRQSAHGGRTVIAHGFAYTAGVVLSLAALATVVCALRAAGTAVGWGFQFQEPWFVASVACILVLFALNCFGVFELYIGDAGVAQAAHRAHGLKRSVFDGVLAVILATPCSAPFLGTAIAFALQQQAWLIYLIFMTIGVGLALPYVVLTAIPQGLKFVPKPGNWMLHLKTLLGFGLLVTAVWLVWVMGRFTGVDGMATLLVVLVLVSLCAWVFGRMSEQAPQRSLPYFGVLLAVVASITLVGLRGALTAPAPGAGSDSGVSEGWQIYSEDAVKTALARKQAVFVDFTADWCLTCKYNEGHVLRDAAVLEGLQSKHVLMLRADWTRRDEAIRKTLSRFGRAGVPMYLLYHPDSPDMPQLLPELLSVGQLRDAIGNLP